ncbi:MAG: hypothetical protein O2875_07435 [Planctomycetota bacterium]|nr:hypothetical protein [Planctomycetota bacterium]MDA1262706.1 hypothetical protein [Planctomycetota bacterium]
MTFHSRTTALFLQVIIIALICAVTLCGFGCEQTKTVHVKRSAGMLGLEGAVGQETVLEDGSRVVVVDELPKKKTATEKAAAAKMSNKIVDPIFTAPPYSLAGQPPPLEPKKEPPKELKLREEERDGSITLRAAMPEHVMAHFVEAVKNQEYGPFYSQMLADEAHQAYERAGGEAVFVEWAEKNRKELLTFLNRMGSNWSGSEVVTEKVSTFRMRYRLDRRNLPDIRFEVVEIVNEHGGVRLAMIR